MDIIYKVLITILSIIILLSTGFSVTLCIADEIETNHYFTSVAETLIDSHYNEQIIEQLIEEAAEKDYELTIEIFGSTAPGAYCSFLTNQFSTLISCGSVSVAACECMYPF